MTLAIAYISQGKLFLYHSEESVREIESEFGRGIQERSQRAQQKPWKNRSLMDMMLPPGVAKQMQAQMQEAAVNISITSICKANSGQILYALESDSVSGIFKFHPDRNREDRIFHNADFKVSYLDLKPSVETIACTTHYSNGSSNIATMVLDSSRPRDITEGDSIDLAPSWVPGSAKCLVFQSAGLARNAEGYVYERSAFRIEKLDFDQQDVSTIAEDPKSDFLGPKMDAQGNLYYIRRPYKDRRPKMSFLQLLKTIVLIPVRFIQAIYAWLDFFTRRYTGKPLFSAGDDRQSIAPQVIKAWGDWISPEMLQKGNKNIDPEAPALVPDHWELVRQTPQGTPEILATGVLHYDLSEDGTVVYTNGSAIFTLSPQGKHNRIHIGKSIESIALLN